MALRILKMRRSLELKRQKLAELMERDADFEARHEELAAAIEEVETEEDQELIDEQLDEYEEEKEAHEKEKMDLESEIKSLEDEIEEEEAKAPVDEPAEATKERTQRGDVVMRNSKMRKGIFAGMDVAEARSIVETDEVRDFLQRAREMKGQQRGVTGAELTIPTTMVGIVRDSLHRYSKLLSVVRTRPLKGKARMTVAGAIPEGIWLEACGPLSELEISFNEIEMDGYKVGGYMAICNATLEDSDLNLAGEIFDNLAQAIGLAIDKAILYGSGVKMPLGIVTRLAQTIKPDAYPTKAPEWVDLSATNVKQVAGATGEELFANMILAAAAAKSNYGTEGKFWAMSEATKATLMSKLVTFNAAGAIVADVNDTLPIIGGQIVVLPFIPDGDIIGGYGSQYLMVERSGMSLGQSEHAQFIEENTLFRASARYDGAPTTPGGFVALNIAGADPTKTIDFAVPTP